MTGSASFSVKSPDRNHDISNDVDHVADVFKETTGEKIALFVSTVALLLVLLFLWVYYR